MIQEILSSTKDITNCLSNCSSHGKCKYLASLNSFKCECDSFYSGYSCQQDIRPCSTQPCLNNGTCLEGNSSSNEFNCDCGKYYYGARCENKVDLCQNETCSNNGNCIRMENNNVKCSCFYLFIGEKCQTVSEEKLIIKTFLKTSSIIAIVFITFIYVLFLINDILTCFKGRSKKIQKRR